MQEQERSSSNHISKQYENKRKEKKKTNKQIAAEERNALY